MPGRIPILEPDVPPKTVVHMVASKSELRYCYYMLVFISFMSALVGYGLAQGTNDWLAWVARIGTMAAYGGCLVAIAKSRFTLWRLKGDLFR